MQNISRRHLDPGNSGQETTEETNMSIFSTLERFISDYSASRARYLTERAIGGLPIELQKDIGWPGASETRMPHRPSVGHWAGGL